MASHAGLDPEQGVSAILEASHQIQRLFELNDPRARAYRERRHDRRRPAPERGRSRGDRGGRRAGAARRGRTQGRGGDPRAGARAARGSRSRSRAGSAARRSSPRRATGRCGRRRAGAADGSASRSSEAAVGGASDGNITSAYTATLDGLGPVGDGAHAAHEYVLVSQMPERAALLALLVHDARLTAVDRRQPTMPTHVTSRSVTRIADFARAARRAQLEPCRARTGRPATTCSRRCSRAARSRTGRDRRPAGPVEVAARAT